MKVERGCRLYMTDSEAASLSVTKHIHTLAVASTVLVVVAVPGQTTDLDIVRYVAVLTRKCIRKQSQMASVSLWQSPH